MFVIFIIIIVILILIYFSEDRETNSDALKYSKIILSDINYEYRDKLLLPAILPVNKLNCFKIYKKKFPLLFIPDIGGNKLYGKWNISDTNSCCNKQFFSTQVWPSPKYLSPFIPFADCWKQRFIPNKNFTNKKNINIFTKNFGSIHEMDILYKFGKGIAFSFYPLINSLKSYKNGKNLFGAPYDFRIISNQDALQDYFKKLKILVEFAYKKNSKPIILIGHTLGGILINIFLNYHVNNNWKKKYIKSFIAIHAPFYGCDVSNTAIYKGMNEGLCTRSIAYSTNLWYRDIFKHIGGLYLLLKKSNIPFLKKLIFFRKINPLVKVYFIECNSDLIDVTIPNNWDITSYKIHCSHKKILNNLEFLKIFSSIIFN